MLRKMLLAAAAALAGLLVTQMDIRPSEAMPLGGKPSAGVKDAGSPVELAGRRGYGRYYNRGGYGGWRYGRYPRYGYRYNYGYPRYYRYGYPRYYSRYRYPYYGGYGYGYPGWGYGGLGIALGFGGWGYYGGSYGGYGNYYNNGGYAHGGRKAHVRWCLNRYRSYNPRTDTYLGYDGYRHRCRGPY